MTVLIDASVRITVLALTVWLIAALADIKSARLLHGAWTAVMLLMLSMPLIERVPVHVDAAVLAAEFDAAHELRPSPPLDARATQVRRMNAAPSSTHIPMADLWRIYWVGAASLLLRLAVGTAGVIRFRRGAAMREGYLTHPECSAPMTIGWWMPAMIVPPAWWRWSTERRTAVILHEQAHMKRRDPLIQWLAQLNRAVFWFHPLAWWLERYLARLAETVCDEAVLRHGVSPERYANDLVAIATVATRRFPAGPVVGMPGSRLPARVHAILGYRGAAQQSRRMALVAASVGFVVVTFVCVFITPVRAQTAASFDVASVLPEDMPRNYIRTQVTGRTFIAEGTSAAVLIRYAYDLKDFQLDGGPDWIYDRETQFNIHATFTGEGTSDSVRAMVRALLAERFGLTVHRDQKQGSTFELSVVRGGARLTPSKHDNPERRGCFPYPATCTDVTMSDFADYLSAIVLSQVVVDNTGLTGRYDLKMMWSPDNSQFRGNGGRGFFSGEGPSLFTALQEQVGLQLKATRGGIPIVVVDTISAPSPN